MVSVKAGAVYADAAWLQQAGSGCPSDSCIGSLQNGAEAVDAASGP